MMIWNKTMAMSNTQIVLALGGAALGFYMAHKGGKKMLHKALYTVGGVAAGVVGGMVADAAINKIKGGW